ncbi:ribosomal protein L14 [Arctopsyche grandis]|uniref:ribosomal protein L14 n=1 Tax=Arctopsyche grandis TaxID=121162 RepID=UPI00406D6890
MPFDRFVQTGRVALVADGTDKGRLVTIVDVIDQTRVLVDGPCSNVMRKGLRINQLQLTKLRIKFPHTASTRVVRKAWEAADLSKKWAETQWAKKLDNKEKRANMGDLDRFKLQLARRERNRLRTVAYKNLKAKAVRTGSLFGKKSIKPKKATKKPARNKKPVNKSAKKEAKTAKPAAPKPAAAKPAAAKPAAAAAKPAPKK